MGCAVPPLQENRMVPIRLAPGSDIRRTLEDALATESPDSAFVVAGIGSLVQAVLRYAGAGADTVVPGPLEILSISGSLSQAGAHLHMTVSDASGRVVGGHVSYGNTVRTTAEILLVPLRDWSLTREHDPATGYKELVVRRSK
jgi:predicted DNA-binding protein with PD1-like motif